MAEFPNMAIKGGNSDPYIDFMRYHLRDMVRPETDDQDPAVAARCPDVLKQALNLIFRFAEQEQLTVPQPVIATPRIGYETHDGLDGCIQFVGRFQITDPEVPEFDLSKSQAELRGGVLDERTLTGIVFVHGHKAYRNTFTGGLRAASMGDLNYFKTTIEKVQAAFPRPQN